MGHPVDVELAWEGGTLYLLQCRPVTALGAAVTRDETLAPDTRSERLTDLLGDPLPASPVRFVSAGGVPPGTWKHHWHYPTPVTPLYADFEFAAHLPLADLAGKEAFALAEAHAPNVADRRRAFIVVDGYAYRMANGRTRPNPAPRGDDGYQWTLWRRWKKTLRPRLVDDLRRFGAVDLPRVDDAALLEHIRALSRFSIECWGTLHGPFAAFNTVRKRCRAFCAEHLGLGEADFLALFAGCSESTSAPVRAMEEVAAQVRSDPGLSTALQSGDPWASPLLRTALAGYVEAYAHKASDWEYVSPTLAERPDRLVQLLRDAVARLESGTAGANDEVHRRRRALEDSLRTRLPDPSLREKFDALLHDAQLVFGSHEDAVNLYNLSGGYLRYALLEAGERFTRRRLLPVRDRVFFVRRPELEAVLSGGTVSNLGSLAEARWHAYQAQKSHRPSALVSGPRIEQAERSATERAPLTPLAVEPLTPGQAMHGLGASPGTYEGTLRVVLTEDEFEQVQVGDVLVSPQTSPSWTVLFGRIGALVTDDGGILSHSAIASREFGIPAVLSTGIATRALATGQRIRVDGTAGTVTVL
jgi:rifampicin phosphotransferase